MEPVDCGGLLPLDCPARRSLLRPVRNPRHRHCQRASTPPSFAPGRQEAADLHRALSIPPEERVVLFAAPAFSREKGFDLFLELARSCRGLPSGFSPPVVAAPAGPDANLTVLGHVSGREYMAVLYTAADALVLCSRQDNFPTVCLEAAACGTPVVGFSVGGVAETILPGLGTAVPPGTFPLCSVHCWSCRLPFQQP